MKLIIFITATLLGLVKGIPKPETKRHPTTFIVGGRPADQGEVPYQLGLRYNGQHFCGASLIEVQGVTVAVTAAHCTPSHIPIETLTVVAGDLSISDSSGLEQTRQVTRIVAHEAFDEYTYENDISLVFLDAPFELNENVKTIDLPPRGASTSGQLFVSGWGKLEHEGPSPDILQAVEIPTVESDVCQSAYDAVGEIIFDSFLCAGYLGVGGMDAWQGDSGGPARSISGNYLAGVVSWGESCGDADFPGVYTQVSHFIDWIEQNIAK